MKDKMKKAFEKRGLNIINTIPYKGGGIMVHTESTGAIQSDLYIYHPESGFIENYNPAEHLDEFDDILDSFREKDDD